MRAGLRTEIILSISLLLAAALLFAGFLLVKLTEGNLLDQQRDHAIGIVQLVAAGIEGPVLAADADAEIQLSLASLNRLQAVLGNQADILAWQLLDTRLRVVSRFAYEMRDEFASLSPSTLEKGKLYEHLAYQSALFFSPSVTPGYIDLSTSLWAGNEPYGVLQIRFSLADLEQRVQQSQRLILVYAVVYGLILAAFGVYLLNRNVVKPVRELRQATATVAGGNLTSLITPSGPGEIHDLAESFNSMVTALAASRAEAENHIDSLKETNLALAQAREELIRSEKLATVGHLAAGMAHEIGNPLGAVIGYLNLVREELNGSALDLIERSLVETGRIDKLVRELLEYSAPLERRDDSFCPLDLLRETVELLQHQGQLDGVEVLDRLSAKGCQVKMDRGRLMQVWINLLLNARDAISGQGVIELSALQSAGKIRVSIQDSGSGIDGDIVKRIFEPFFTTKAPGRGYGLGLAVCQRIIVEHGGRIEAHSSAGSGACFMVTLPCAIEELT